MLKALDVPVPEVKLYTDTTSQNKFLILEYIEGMALNQVDRTSADYPNILQQIQSHFVANAFLGNYDVIGFESDNILVDKTGVPYQIDNGGSLCYRGNFLRKDRSHLL